LQKNAEKWVSTISTENWVSTIRRLPSYRVEVPRPGLTGGATVPEGEKVRIHDLKKVGVHDLSTIWWSGVSGNESGWNESGWQSIEETNGIRA